MGYSYSFNEENFYGDFNTREKAIKEAIDYNPDALAVYIGENVKTFEPFVDGENVIASVIESAFDEAGESSEDYLNHVSRADSQKLDEMLTATFNKWAKETGNIPHFFKVINVKAVIVPSWTGRATK